MSGSAFAVTHHAFSSGAGRTSDGNGSHASTLKSPSYTKSVSWQHYRALRRGQNADCGISVTEYNDVIMDEFFLDYAISEFERYFKQLEDAVRTYYENSKLQQESESSISK
ncbi:MAG: hypothetical protein E7B29_00005 [Mixta calida]|nr:hypothetical protein [Mixta calida]